MITGPDLFAGAPFLEIFMGLFSLTRRVGRDAVLAVTGGVAALSGAATGAVEGAVTGATQGAKDAGGSGPRLPRLAAVVVAAIGVAGVLEWPVLALGGVAALVLGQQHDTAAPAGVPTRAAPAPSGGRLLPSTAAIRDWARTNGRPVSARGRLSADIVDAFHAAH